MFVLAKVTEKSSSAIHGRNLDLKKKNPRCHANKIALTILHVM